MDDELQTLVILDIARLNFVANQGGSSDNAGAYARDNVRKYEKHIVAALREAGRPELGDDPLHRAVMIAKAALFRNGTVKERALLAVTHHVNTMS